MTQEVVCLGERRPYESDHEKVVIVGRIDFERNWRRGWCGNVWREVLF